MLEYNGVFSCFFLALCLTFMNYVLLKCFELVFYDGSNEESLVLSCSHHEALANNILCTWQLLQVSVSISVMDF